MAIVPFVVGRTGSALLFLSYDEIRFDFAMSAILRPPLLPDTENIGRKLVEGSSDEVPIVPADEKRIGLKPRPRLCRRSEA